MHHKIPIKLFSGTVNVRVAKHPRTEPTLAMPDGIWQTGRVSIPHQSTSAAAPASANRWWRFSAGTPSGTVKATKQGDEKK